MLSMKASQNAQYGKQQKTTLGYPHISQEQESEVTLSFVPQNSTVEENFLPGLFPDPVHIILCYITVSYVTCDFILYIQYQYAMDVDIKYYVKNKFMFL